MTRLAGRRILLTGATGGLGQALSRGLVAAGCAGLAVTDVDAPALEELGGELQDAGTDVRALSLDVRDPSAFAAVVDDVVAAWGGIDVLINHAGVLSPPARLHNTAFDDLARVMDVNLNGAFHGMQAVLPHMRATGSGVIINTGSVAGLTAWSHSTPYCVSKAAVIHLTRVAALEYATEGIRVNCVAPGAVHTAIHDELPDEALRSIADRHPIGRLGTPDEVVGAYVYLASDEASFVTGSVLTVDGGYTVP